jgi:hypothetical protein
MATGVPSFPVDLHSHLLAARPIQAFDATASSIAATATAVVVVVVIIPVEEAVQK